MENSGEVFSIWVGKKSQQLAHHFYALQSQQFFDEQEDPIDHNRLWKLYDVHGDVKRPYSMTFDTQIPHLNHLRQINHSKIIKQMQASQMKLDNYNFFGQSKFNKVNAATSKKEASMEQKDSYLYSKWQATENNYCVIDRKFIQTFDNFDYWKEVFKAGQQSYEEKMRKNFQKLDFLKAFTFCSDLEKNGFSLEILYYLKDQCTKKPIYFYQLEGKQEDNAYYELRQLHSLAEIGNLTQTYLNINTQLLASPYFQSQNPIASLAPLFNCLFTPLYLKNNSQTNSAAYLENILNNPRRNIFDVAYTLPHIDYQQHLSRQTNIFDYLLQNKHDKFFTTQQEELMEKNQDKMSKQQEQKKIMNIDQIYQNKINYGKDYLGLRNEQKNAQKAKQNQNFMFKQGDKKPQQIYSNIISEAYVLKGQVNQKTFSTLFAPNSQLLDLKYLQGIICNYNNELKYHKNYNKLIGKNKLVQNYPFHTVLFQHKDFAGYLRKLAAYKQKKYSNQLLVQWKQNMMTQADYYKEINQDEDD